MLRTWLHHPPGVIGFRGAALLSLAFIWFVLGVASLTEPRPAVGEYVYIHQMIPNEVRAALWVVTGIVGAVHAFDPPFRDDGRGFQALLIMPTERALSYLWGWVVYLAPDGSDGSERGWVGFALFAALVNITLLISRWREPLPVNLDDHPAVEGGETT